MGKRRAERFLIIPRWRGGERKIKYMDIGGKNEQIRKKLDRIYYEEDYGKDVYTKRTKKAKEILPTLRIEKKEILPWDNCYTYALDMPPDIKKSCTLRNKNIIILIKKGILQEISFEQTRNGDIIIYWKGEQLKHTGKIYNGKVKSRWGAGNPYIYEHEITEIPGDYGNEVKFYKKPDKKPEELCKLAGFRD